MCSGYHSWYRFGVVNAHRIPWNFPLIGSHAMYIQELLPAHSCFEIHSNEQFRALNLFKLPLFLHNHNRNRALLCALGTSLDSRVLVFGCYVGVRARIRKLFQFIYNKTQHEVSLTDEKHNQLENDLAGFCVSAPAPLAVPFQSLVEYEKILFPLHFLREQAQLRQPCSPKSLVLAAAIKSMANNNTVNRLRGAPNACKH